MKKKKRKFELVQIAWQDAETDDGWFDHIEIENDAIGECETVGFVIRETKLWLWLTHTITDSQYNGCIRIPKGWIKRRKKIASIEV